MWVELRKRLSIFLFYFLINKKASNHCIFCFVSLPVQTYRTRKSYEACETGKVTQQPVQKPPFQQISQVSSFEGLLTPILVAGLFAKPGERRSKDTGTLRQGRCWASSEKLLCASRERSWMAGSTGLGKAALSDKKAMHKSDWSEVQAYSSIFALLKCKIQFCKRRTWKVFARTFPLTPVICSVRLSRGKQHTQVPTLTELLRPLGAQPRGFHPINICLQGCYIGGNVSAEVPKLHTLSSTKQERERRKGYTQFREQFLWSERQQIKACFFCYAVPCIRRNLPAIMSQSPLNNLL